MSEPRSEHVTPGHPVKEGRAGYDCNCGECLWRRGIEFEMAPFHPDQLVCLDSRGEPGWTCMEFDGTGLWCAACLEMDALLGFLLATHSGSPGGPDV